MTMPKQPGNLACRFNGWAEKRSLGPVSVASISLALGGCAAGWLSAGNPADSAYGGLALCACYLAWRGARRLARMGATAAGPDAAGGADGRAAGLVRTSGTVSTCLSLAGLAAGGHAAHLASTWGLATAAVIVMSARDVAYACRGWGADTAPGGSPLGRAIRGSLMFPFGGRVALIAVVTPVWGPGVALLALLEWAVVGTGYTLTRPRPDRSTAPVPVPAEAMLAADGPLAAHAVDAGVAAVAADATALMEAAVPIDAAAPVDAVIPADATVPMAAGTRAAGGSATTLDLMIHDDLGEWRQAAPAAPPDPRVLAIIRASRDDGAVALRLGRAVRGQFVPLPPALAGLAATSLLAWLGMRNLPGLLLLTPLVVTLLAGFGSAHPHDRALDWLTPGVLLAVQLEYAAAVGFAFRVPPPLTFTLCALIGLRHVSIARGDLLNAARAPGARFGWEGRMLVIGAGAMLGIATVAYAALALQVAWILADTVLPRYARLPPQRSHLQL